MCVTVSLCHLRLAADDDVKFEREQDVRHRRVRKLPQAAAGPDALALEDEEPPGVLQDGELEGGGAAAEHAGEPGGHDGDRAAVVGRAAHPKSCFWCGCRIIYRPASLNQKPRWQANCGLKAHNLPGQALCRKTLTCESTPEAESVCLRRIQHWLNLA
eukprot:121881-Lingulodinium_polyedra.AAC.1